MVKIGELSDRVRQTGIRADLEEEVLGAIFLDIFKMGLYILPITYPIRLLSRVDITNDIQNIDNFVTENSLSEHREGLLQVRHYIFENCEELTFRGSYMANYRRATESITIYRYHEFNNPGVDLKERLIDNINALVGAGSAGLVAGMVGAYVPTFTVISSSTLYNTITQGLIWGIVAGGGSYIAIKKIKSIAKKPDRTRRERKFLGDEIITNDEISLEKLGRDLGGNYNGFEPPNKDYFSGFEHGEDEGRYAGRTAGYKVKLPKSTLILSTWMENNPNSALFGVILQDTTPSNIIGSALLEIKVGGERRVLHLIKSFEWNESEARPHEYQSGMYLLNP